MPYFHADPHDGALSQTLRIYTAKADQESVRTAILGGNQYPEIARRARTEGCEIHWDDETVLVNTNVRGRGFAPKGKRR